MITTRLRPLLPPTPCVVGVLGLVMAALNFRMRSRDGGDRREVARRDQDMIKGLVQNQPTDEVMVCLYRAGGAGPLGTKVATLNIGGANWDLHQGDIGWKAHSFVRTGNTTSANLNLTDFTNALVNRGSMARSKHLSNVQAGTEVFQGRGQLDANSCSVTVG